MGSERSRKTPYDSSLYFLLILLSWFCNPFYHPRSFFDALRTGYHIRKNDAMRKTVFSDNIIMSMTFQKAKSCPHPAEKQKWYHTTLRKPKPRYVSANTKRDLCSPGACRPRIVEIPLFQAFPASRYVFLDIKTTVSTCAFLSKPSHLIGITAHRLLHSETQRHIFRLKTHLQ